MSDFTAVWFNFVWRSSWLELQLTNFQSKYTRCAKLNIFMLFLWAERVWQDKFNVSWLWFRHSQRTVFTDKPSKTTQSIFCRLEFITREVNERIKSVLEAGSGDTLLVAPTHLLGCLMAGWGIKVHSGQSAGLMFICLWQKDRRLFGRQWHNVCCFITGSVTYCATV